MEKRGLGSTNKGGIPKKNHRRNTGMHSKGILVGIVGVGGALLKLF